jgi:hypothetical protein
MPCRPRTCASPSTRSAALATTLRMGFGGWHVAEDFVAGRHCGWIVDESHEEGMGCSVVEIGEVGSFVWFGLFFCRAAKMLR